MLNFWSVMIIVVLVLLGPLLAYLALKPSRFIKGKSTKGKKYEKV